MLVGLIVICYGLYWVFFAKSGQYIEASDFGEQWPFSVPSGYVDCIDDLAYVFSSGSEVYGLNGFAEIHGHETAELQDIWLPNPEIDGTRISSGPISRIAAEQC